MFGLKFKTFKELEEYAKPEGLKQWLIEMNWDWIWDKKLLQPTEEESENLLANAKKILPVKKERELFFELNRAVILELKLANGNPLTHEEFALLCGGKYFETEIESLYGDYSFGLGYKITSKVTVNNKAYKLRYFKNMSGELESAIGYLSMDEIAAARKE